MQYKYGSVIYEHANYRSYLREVLADRVRKNPSYSLRAMARQLGVPSSQLSETLSGKVNISVRAARKISHELGLSPDETEYFCLSVQAEAEKNPEIREQLINQLNRFRTTERSIHDLSVDVFRQMSEWYHSAILELAHLDSFALTAESAARKLGISKLDAQVALERLGRLELLEQDRRGRWTRLKQDLQFVSPEKNVAMRKFYRQMLEKISGALEDQEPFKERLSGYETIPFSREALPEAKKAVDRFFEEMIRIARKYPKKTDVYHLAVHFFNLTHANKEGRSS